MHGTTSDTKMNSGNFAPYWGFGHLGILVPNVEAAQAKFRELGVKILKPLGEATVESCNVIDNEQELTRGFQNIYKQIIMIEDPDGKSINV